MPETSSLASCLPSLAAVYPTCRDLPAAMVAHCHLFDRQIRESTPTTKGSPQLASTSPQPTLPSLFQALQPRLDTASHSTTTARYCSETSHHCMQDKNAHKPHKPPHFLTHVTVEDHARPFTTGQRCTPVPNRPGRCSHIPPPPSRSRSEGRMERAAADSLLVLRKVPR